MTDKKEIQCEYCTVRSNENKCKALEIDFHNCLNILEQKKCPIYKLKQQLQEKEKECEELKQWKKDAENLFKTQTDNFDKIINRNKQALEEIRKIIVKMSTKTILTFPDFTREENLKGVMKQCCSGYIEILNIINKAKAVNNDR